MWKPAEWLFRPVVVLVVVLMMPATTGRGTAKRKNLQQACFWMLKDIYPVVHTPFVSQLLGEVSHTCANSVKHTNASTM